MQFASPRTSPTRLKREQSFLVALAGVVVVRACERDIAEAFDAVCLAEDVSGAPEER